jgi:hypothetical protein
MPGIGRQPRAGLFGGLELVSVLQECRKIRPLPADAGLDRVHLAEAVGLQDAGAIAAGKLRTHSGFQQVPGGKISGGKAQMCGHGRKFSRSHQDALFPPAALAALTAGENWSFVAILHQVIPLSYLSLNLSANVLFWRRLYPPLF